MKDKKNIDESLSETIQYSNLENITEGIAETVLDSIMHDGFLKDLPIIGTIVNMGKVAMDIRNQLFLKKVIHFLAELNQIPAEKRQLMIQKVDVDPRYRIKVGEQLNYIIDKCNDHLHAEYVSQFFKAYVLEKISYLDFLQGSQIIQKIFIEDLENFLKSDSSCFNYQSSPEDAPGEEDLPLINAGILGVGYNPVRVDDETEPDRFERYSVTGGEAVVWITTIGDKIKSNLSVKT